MANTNGNIGTDVEITLPLVGLLGVLESTYNSAFSAGYTAALEDEAEENETEKFEQSVSQALSYGKGYVDGVEASEAAFDASSKVYELDYFDLFADDEDEDDFSADDDYYDWCYDIY